MTNETSGSLGVEPSYLEEFLRRWDFANVEERQGFFKGFARIFRSQTAVLFVRDRAEQTGKLYVPFGCHYSQNGFPQKVALPPDVELARLTKASVTCGRGHIADVNLDRLQEVAEVRAALVVPLTSTDGDRRLVAVLDSRDELAVEGKYPLRYDTHSRNLAEAILRTCTRRGLGDPANDGVLSYLLELPDLRDRRLEGQFAAYWQGDCKAVAPSREDAVEMAEQEAGASPTFVIRIGDPPRPPERPAPEEAQRLIQKCKKHVRDALDVFGDPNERNVHILLLSDAFGKLWRERNSRDPGFLEAMGVLWGCVRELAPTEIRHKEQLTALDAAFRGLETPRPLADTQIQHITRTLARGGLNMFRPVLGLDQYIR